MKTFTSFLFFQFERYTILVQLHPLILYLKMFSLEYKVDFSLEGHYFLVSDSTQLQLQLQLHHNHV